MKGLTTMYDHRGKILGFIISAIGLCAMVVERVSQLTFIRDWNVKQHYYLFFWVTLLGLVLIAYSREKEDDERAQSIRLKAVQFSFIFLLAILMSLGLTAELNGAEKVPLEGSLLLFLAGMALLTYLFLFHIGLYRDDAWEYENKGLWYNLSHIPRNIWGILLYFLIMTVIMVLLNWAMI